MNSTLSFHVSTCISCKVLTTAKCSSAQGRVFCQDLSVKLHEPRTRELIVVCLYCTSWLLVKWTPVHIILRSIPVTELKSNFLRLEKLVLLGGPADGVIKPWQSRCVCVCVCACVHECVCEHCGVCKCMCVHTIREKMSSCLAGTCMYAYTIQLLWILQLQRNTGAL